MVQDRLKSLITEVEQVLWEGKLADHQAVLLLLERVRHYLLTCQSKTMADNYDISAEKLTKIVLNQLETEIDDCLQPLREELTQLQHQRQLLLQDIKTLEEQRQQILSDFVDDLSDYHNNFSQESLKIPRNKAFSDFDQGLHQVFETLVEDLQRYSESLNEGLERMHHLGQQGEAKFLASFNRLQQQLDASFRQIRLTRSDNNAMEVMTGCWYLGIDLTASRLTVVLLMVDADSSQPCLCDSLVERFNLSVSDALLNGNRLDYWKHVLNRLSKALAASEASSLKLGELPLQRILAQLEGIVLIYPSWWHESDRTLMQTLILENSLVATADDIVWIPKAIALTLAYESTKQQNQSSQFSLVIGLNETTTELALIDISQGVSELITQQFSYGTQAMDQDILCQLIYPQWYAQMTQTVPVLKEPFPTPGGADLLNRETLTQQLENHPLGDAFLEAAKLTRLILQRQDTFSSTLAQHPWGVTREQMNKTIINAWVKQIEQQIQTLFNQVESPPNLLSQIILSGEDITTINYGFLDGLTERFPQAQLIEVGKEDSNFSIFQGLTHLLLHQRQINKSKKQDELI